MSEDFSRSPRLSQTHSSNTRTDRLHQAVATAQDINRSSREVEITLITLATEMTESIQAGLTEEERRIMHPAQFRHNLVAFVSQPGIDNRVENFATELFDTFIQYSGEPFCLNYTLVHTRPQFTHAEIGFSNRAGRTLPSSPHLVLYATYTPNLDRTIWVGGDIIFRSAESPPSLILQTLFEQMPSIEKLTLICAFLDATIRTTNITPS